MKTRVLAARVSENDYQRLEEIAAGRPLSDVLREAIISKLEEAGEPAGVHATGGGTLTSAPAAAGLFPSDDPPPTAAANGDGEAALDNPNAVDGAGEMTPAAGRQPRAGSGDVDPLLELALYRAAARKGFKDPLPEVVNRFAGVSHLDEDRLMVTFAGKTVPFDDAVHDELLKPTGGPGSGKGAPREVEIRPTVGALEKGVGSQAFFEQNTAAVFDAERAANESQ